MQEWISIEDRLPRDNERVIVLTATGCHMAVFRFSGALWEGAGVTWNPQAATFHKTLFNSDITHWIAAPPHVESREHSFNCLKRFISNHRYVSYVEVDCVKDCPLLGDKQYICEPKKCEFETQIENEGFTVYKVCVRCAKRKRDERIQ